MKNTSYLATITVLLVLVLDQASKFWVKLNMTLTDEIAVAGNWFYINFTENNGMAFGIEFAGEYGKLILTLFRIVAVSGILYFLVRMIRTGSPKGLVISLSLILAGAFGNIVDSVFYGIWFNDSYHQVATFLPDAGGYSKLFHGKVVDMLYFPILSGHFPDWMPFWGGDPFLFFRPVFNIADSSITVGVGMIILFQKKFFANA
ncbi:lipoprotein signal peptidase [bacterium SCSIO 12741]|nr:lipoprotein signal peptidase [bacterium SCSIO 12741]